MELLEGPEVLGLIMPFGDAPMAAAGAHWQPVEARIQALKTALSKVRLDLDDIAQGRSWGGIPFLFDFSDLRMLSPYGQ